MADALREWPCEVLGRCEVAGDCSWQHRMSRVLRLRGPDGAQWIVKQHRDTGRYQAELAAYQQWVPALGSRAPMLRAHDDHLGAILISAVSGQLAAWPEPGRPPGGTERAGELAVHRDAGVALRLLHDAHPPWPDLARQRMRADDPVQRRRHRV